MKPRTYLRSIGIHSIPSFRIKCCVNQLRPPWTGWHVGGNVGYSWGDAHTDLFGTGNGTTSCPSSVCTGAPNPIFPYSFTVADANTTRLNGAIGGAQVGYNFQISPTWVAGFEADLQASGEQGSNNLFDPFSTPACASFFDVSGNCAVQGSLSGAFATSENARIEWFGTVRGCVGYLIGDQVLLYGTGGLAYGRVKVSGNSLVSALISPGAFLIGPGAAAFSESTTNVGWTAGAGIEGRFAYWLPAGWTWKLEYLYVDLGSLDTSTPFAAASSSLASFFPPFSGTVTTHTHFTDNILRVGLNYQFH